MKLNILQMSPIMPHVEAALAAAYEVHRYWQADDRSALLAKIGARWRPAAIAAARETSSRRCRNWS
jgi:hypothetical protein